MAAPPRALQIPDISASNQLSFAERDIAHGARRKQLVDLEPALAQPLLVGILQQRLDGRAVRFDAVGVPIRPDDRLLLLYHGLQPRERRLGRAGLQQQSVAMLLGPAERLVEAHRHPGIALMDIAADHHGVHDRVDFGSADSSPAPASDSRETAGARWERRAG